MVGVDLRVGDACRLLKSLPDESIDLCIFSPPYDHLRTYSGQYSFDYQRLGKRLFRVMKPGGVCAVVIGDGTVKGCKTLTSFRFPIDWVDNAGWGLWDTLIYNRHGMYTWESRFRIDHEYIHIFVKGNRPQFVDKKPLEIESNWAGCVMNSRTKRKSDGRLENALGQVNMMKCRGTVWKLLAGFRGNRLKHEHPATFPDQLARDIIVCFCPPNGTVLDPYVGSGTTCVQSYLFKRHSIGFDISADYVNLAWRRIARECLQHRLMEWVYECDSRTER